MEFLHERKYLHRGDAVIVASSHQCNILLTDDSNFSNYKTGRAFTHEGGGGFFEKLPARLIVPRDGNWNITLDLAGGTATIKHSITIVKA